VEGSHRGAKSRHALKEYVIGGMDRGFKLKLHHPLRAMEDAGLMPGITSAFRDDYRQSLASGDKTASDNSYHCGSRRGGYGQGLAVDLVSVKGETRMERDSIWSSWCIDRRCHYGDIARAESAAAMLAG
jgi:hypothetical protein